MKVLHVVLLLSLPPFLCLAATCPCGATYNSQFNKCYNFIATPQSFNDSRQTCRSVGGQLVSIQNGFENTFISQLATDASVTDDFWTGGSDAASRGTWTWDDASTFNYTNWGAGYPDGRIGNDCISVVTRNEKWRSSDCSTKKSFLCEIPLSTQPTYSSPSVTAPSCPSPPPPPHCQQFCESEWTYFSLTDACYQTFLGDEWAVAEQGCLSMNSHLASIHTYPENRLIIFMSQTGLTLETGWTWIGLHSETPGEWTWSDGSTLDYTLWAPGHPSLAAQCAVLVADNCANCQENTFKWVSRDCGTKGARNFVCKKDAKH